MKWGIIGTGNMGSMLTTAFLKSGAVTDEQLTVYNRSSEKTEALQKEFPKINVAKNLQDLQKQSDILFICVKPHHYPDILKELRNHFTAETCLVSITSPISVEELESATPCQVARIVPSITNHALAGVSLFTFGERITDHYKQTLLDTFSKISKPMEIDEEYIRVSSDIVSCGPAFVSFLLKNWISAAQQVAGISEEKATLLTENMVIGLGSLFEKRIFTLEELMEKVTVKGGVTGEGLQALEDHIGELFSEMFKATQAKHKDDKQKIDL